MRLPLFHRFEDLIGPGEAFGLLITHRSGVGGEGGIVGSTNASLPTPPIPFDLRHAKGTEDHWG